MSIKVNNHLIPNFILKKWYLKNDEKIYSKKNGDFRKYKTTDYSVKNYYGDILENKLSLVESDIAPIIQYLDENDEIELSHLQYAMIVLYIKIQAIRMENVCHFIDSTDEYFPGNNNFLFGVYTTSDKDEAIKITEIYVDTFIKIRKYSDKQLIDDNLLANFLSEMGLVIMKNNNESNVMGDKGVLKEVDIDGRFLYLAMPISPKTMLFVSKGKYFANENRAFRLMNRNGDTWISAGVPWQLLINYHDIGEYFLNAWHIARPKKDRVVNYDPVYINAVMAQDSKNLICFNKSIEELKKLLNMYIGLREIE